MTESGFWEFADCKTVSFLSFTRSMQPQIKLARQPENLFDCGFVHKRAAMKKLLRRVIPIQI